MHRRTFASLRPNESAFGGSGGRSNSVQEAGTLTLHRSTEVSSVARQHRLRLRRARDAPAARIEDVGLHDDRRLPDV